MKHSKAIFYFETEHRYTLRNIYNYLITLFPQSLSYSEFVHFSLRHSTFDIHLSNLYKKYNPKHE